MSYVACGNLYSTQTEMLEGMAREFLTVGGKTSAAEVAALKGTNREIADECISGWSLSQAEYEKCYVDGGKSHMKEHGYTKTSLVKAIGRVRQQIVVELADFRGRVAAVRKAVRVAAEDADEDADTFSLTIRQDEGKYTAVAAFRYDNNLTVMLQGDEAAVARVLQGDEDELSQLVSGYDDDWVEELVAQDNGYEWRSAVAATDIGGAGDNPVLPETAFTHALGPHCPHTENNAMKTDNSELVSEMLTRFPTFHTQYETVDVITEFRSICADLVDRMIHEPAYASRAAINDEAEWWQEWGTRLHRADVATADAIRDGSLSPDAVPEWDMGTDFEGNVQAREYATASRLTP